MNSWTPDIYHVMNRRRVTLKCKLHLYYVPFVQSKVASRPVARVFLKGGSKMGFTKFTRSDAHDVIAMT